MDASAAASTVEPAAATVTGKGLFPAAPVRGAAGAPASATESAAAAVATAAVEATIPPDGTGGTAAARGGLSPTPPVDWTTARHDQPPETDMTQQRRYRVTPAMTRSRSWRTGMFFALLGADEQMLCSLATGPEVDGDPELPAALACDSEAPETYAQVHTGPHERIWGAAERKEFAGLTATGTFKLAGVSVWRSSTAFRLDLCLLFWQPTPA